MNSAMALWNLGLEEAQAITDASDDAAYDADIYRFIRGETDLEVGLEESWDLQYAMYGPAVLCYCCNELQESDMFWEWWGVDSDHGAFLASGYNMWL